MSGFLERVAARAQGTAPLARLRAPIRADPLPLAAHRGVARAERRQSHEPTASPPRTVSVPAPEPRPHLHSFDPAAPNLHASLPPSAARHPSRREVPAATDAESRGELGQAPVVGLSLPRHDDAEGSRRSGSVVPGEEAVPDGGFEPRRRELRTDEIVRDHVVPALVEAGALPGDEVDRVVVLRDGERAPADLRPLAPVVRLSSEPDRSARGGDVHVHIGRVEVLRPAPAQAPAPRRRQAPVDHDAYLARRRDDRP